MNSSVVLWIRAQRTGACKVPVFLQVLISRFGVIHEVDIADEGVLGQVPHGDFLDGLHSNLASREPDAAVGLTRVVKHRAQEVDPGPEWLGGE